MEVKASTISRSAAPAVILLGTQLGENIGTAARAMHNFGLIDLRLVAPCEGWSGMRASAAAAGGAALLKHASAFDDLPSAVADLHYVIAASARRRNMNKPVLSPTEAVASLASAKGGILFGPERSGLDNEAISLCDAIVEIPANPNFSSLNLAQAVLILGYHWHVAFNPAVPTERAALAPKNDLLQLFTHLEGSLDEIGFFRPPEKREGMIRNLRNLFHRAHLSLSEVKALRGVIAALSDRRHKN